MKRALITLIVLLQCLAFGTPSFAATKFDASLSFQQQAKHPTCHFRKQARQSVFQKKKLRRKLASERGWLNFGGKALIVWSLAAVALFASQFWLLAIIAWGASIVLAVIGLFKDDRKAAAIVALALALLLPVAVLIVIALSWPDEP